MCDLDRIFFSDQADDYEIADLGVIKEGLFNKEGMPTGWELHIDKLGTQLPRWLLTQPVMTVGEFPNIYIRGMWSKRLKRDIGKEQFSNYLKR